MRHLCKFLLSAVLFSFTPCDAFANDTLSVETEALEIADRVRCLVCSDENIETAKDETAKDMRFFIRKHLTEGKTQDLVIHLLLAQYGDMISLEDPRTPTARNEGIFAAFSFISCFAAMVFYIRRRNQSFNV